MKDVRTKLRKIVPSPCPHWLNPSHLLSVRTHHKFRNIRSFLHHKCGRLHLKKSSLSEKCTLWTNLHPSHWLRTSFMDSPWLLLVYIMRSLQNGGFERDTKGNNTPKKNRKKIKVLYYLSLLLCLPYEPFQHRTVLLHVFCRAGPPRRVDCLPQRWENTIKKVH